MIENRNAIPVGKYKGRRFYRVPVCVLFNDSRRLSTIAQLTVTVLAPSAADAANYMRDAYATRPETEVFAKRPKGAIVKRYVGWESAIGATLFGERDRPRQLALWEVQS